MLTVVPRLTQRNCHRRKKRRKEILTVAHLQDLDGRGKLGRTTPKGNIATILFTVNSQRFIRHICGGGDDRPQEPNVGDQQPEQLRCLPIHS